MLTTREEKDALVVDADSRYVRMLAWVFAAGFVVAWVAPVSRRAAAGWSLICLIFGAALLAANERSRFVFDRRARLVRWSRTSRWRTEEGEIPFESIRKVDIEHDFVGAAPSRGRGGARRLVLLTASGPIPFTSAFTGWGPGIENAAAAIDEYLREANAS